MNILAVQRHDDLSGLRHAVVETKKLKSIFQRRDVRFLLVERKAELFDVAFQCLQTFLRMVSAVRQCPCIIHISDVAPCVHPFLHVVIHRVQKRNTCNLYHLRTGIVSSISRVLRVQHIADHLIDLIAEISVEVLLHQIMLHVRVIAVNICLYYPSVKAVMAVKVPEVLFQPFPGKIRSFSLLAGAVVEDKVLRDFRI